MYVCLLAIGPAWAAAPVLELPPETAKLKPSNLPGFLVAQQKCGICHSADYISYQPPKMTQAQWTAEMTKMQQSYGAPISEREIELLGAYLADAYGDADSVAAADRGPAEGRTVVVGSGSSQSEKASIDVQALLNNNACLGCHAVERRVVGPSYREVAKKYEADPAATVKVSASIKTGGVGRWGQVPMPPFGGLTEAELTALGQFILKQRD
jgi:cytochrome c551/c552